MKNEEILKKLRDAKGFVSGQELCTYYGVSRTAIWKVIRQLEKDGYVIEAQNNKGYRLVENENADLFSKVEIESKIETNWVGRNIIFHKETSSTNIDAKELAEKGEAAGTVVVADMQTARQRLGISGRKGYLYDSCVATTMQTGESFCVDACDGACSLEGSFRADTTKM